MYDQLCAIACMSEIMVQRAIWISPKHTSLSRLTVITSYVLGVLWSDVCDDSGLICKPVQSCLQTGLSIQLVLAIHTWLGSVSYAL